MNGGLLYISYDGMLEPLGQSQVLAYLEPLARERSIHLISFEKAEDWADRALRESIARRIADRGIAWHPLRYHKRPTVLATAFDIAAGSALAIRIAVRHRLRIVHARSLIAGLIGLATKRATGAALLFDMRGFWADERVDGGLWPSDGPLYRAANRIERRVLAAADHVVTLTQASLPEIARLVPTLPNSATTVIPTCADLSRFRVLGPLQQSPFVLGHVGGVGTWYMLDEMLRCFVLLRELEPDARLLIVNRGEHELIRARASALGLDVDRIEITAVRHEDVPATIARMSAGMAIVKPACSKIASAPTKLGEYLGCGVPCLGNRGIGDVAPLLEEEGVGVALEGFSDDDLRRSLNRLLDLVRFPGIQDRCHNTAKAHFSLDIGVERYARIYAGLEQDRKANSQGG